MKVDRKDCAKAVAVPIAAGGAAFAVTWALGDAAFPGAGTLTFVTTTCALEKSCRRSVVYSVKWAGVYAWAYSLGAYTFLEQLLRSDDSAGRMQTAVERHAAG